MTEMERITAAADLMVKVRALVENSRELPSPWSVREQALLSTIAHLGEALVVMKRLGFGVYQ